MPESGERVVIERMVGRHPNVCVNSVEFQNSLSVLNLVALNLVWKASELRHLFNPKVGAKDSGTGSRIECVLVAVLGEIHTILVL
jgi:hypothetical protein